MARSVALLCLSEAESLNFREIAGAFRRRRIEMSCNEPYSFQPVKNGVLEIQRSLLSAVLSGIFQALEQRFKCWQLSKLVLNLLKCKSQLLDGYFFGMQQFIIAVGFTRTQGKQIGLFL